MPTHSDGWHGPNRPKPNLWRRARFAALERDRWMCQVCGGRAEEVHHIVHLNEGGDMYNLGNLQCLCRPCHWQHHRERDTRKRKPRSDALQRWDQLVEELL